MQYRVTPDGGRLIEGKSKFGDVHIVIAAVLISTVFLILGNLAADLLLYAVDPRIRVE